MGSDDAASHAAMERIQELEQQIEQMEVRDRTTWTVLEQDGPNHLGLW